MYPTELLGLLVGLRLLTELYHLIYPRLSTGFGVMVFFKDLSFMEFHVRYLAGKSWIFYPGNVGVSQGSILGPNDLPDDVIFNIGIYADDATLYTKCDL